MRRIQLFSKTFLFVICISYWQAAASLNLPVSAETDRLLLAAESSFDVKNYSEAKSYLIKAQSLSSVLPEQFYFLYGSTLFHLNEVEKASTNLVKFVEKAERGSARYKEALVLLTEIEKKNPTTINREKGLPKTNEGTSTTSLLENSEAKYMEQLKRLYMTNSTSKALLKHINSMLSTHALKRPTKIVRADQRPLARYRISHDSSGNLITSSQIVNVHDKPDHKSIINTSKMNIYGVDPFVTYRCSTGTNSCWLRSPINSSTWIEFSKDENVARELSKASTALIKVMQKGEY